MSGAATLGETRSEGYYIRVLWTCGNSELCINKERPGTHRQIEDCEECVTGKRPDPKIAQPAQFPELDQK